ncbi:MAG: NADPH:quinone oxidoreductase family protein [Fimbriimonadaceae bacterium]|nr:NADPH:quinone oxidoreductase family protein [Alphaproteobacteria bacterium]
MKAVICHAFGPPETLVVEDIEDPVAGDGEVIVDVTAAALNFFDTLIIENKYQFKPTLPFSPGAEFAGTISAIGPGVEGFALGTRVMGFTDWGTCREKIATKADRIVPIPEGVSDDIAAGIIVTYGTTYYALKDRGALQPGETLAVLGASGGVGLAAVELGKAMGARVIACASSEEKLQFCRDHGADDTVNYSEVDLKDALKDLTGSRGVDVVYDPVGGDYAEQALRACGWGGRFLVIGFAAGTIPKIPLNLPLLKSNSIIGVFWGASVARDTATYRDNNRQIMEWIAAGILDPHVDEVFALEDTALALDAIAKRKVKGKVVVRP